MNSDGGNRLSKRLGFPIRKSPDQSLVADSPRHIAGSHVLHRLLMPMHPPWALKNLNTKAILRCSCPLCGSRKTSTPPGQPDNPREDHKARNTPKKPAPPS